MTGERKDDLAALLAAVFDDEKEGAAAAEAPEVGDYGQRLGAALREAVLHLRSQGTLEVEDASLDALVAEVTEAGLEARSPRQVPKRVVRALIASDHLEEVYGTDEELARALRQFLGEE